MVSTVTNLRLYNSNLTKFKSVTASDPYVKRETDYFKANISSIKTSSDFVNNTRLFTFAMKAFGLSDMNYAKSLMQKLMDGGMSNSSSLANQMSDSRFKEFVEAFDFGDDGASATSSNSSMDGVADKYLDQSFEDDVGQKDEGTQLALYFERNASKYTSGLSIMADKAAYQFVCTAYNIPEAIGSTSDAIDAQAALIERKLNISDLQDSTKVEKMTIRFATLWDMKNNSTDTSDNPALTILNSTNSSSTGSSLISIAAQKYSSY